MIINETGRNQTLIEKFVIGLPISIVHSVKTEFGIQDEDVEAFVLALLEKAVAEKIGEANSKVFSSAEVKELEEDLKGLGYI